MPELDDQITDLSREAQAGFGRNLVLLDEVLGAYADALKTYADGWLGYVRTVESELVPSVFDVATGPVDAVFRAIGNLMRLAVTGGHVEESLRLAYFPVKMAVEAVDWRAPAYFRLLRLYAHFYQLSTLATTPDIQALVRARAWIHPVEGLELMLPIRLKPYRGPVTSEHLALADRAKSALGDTLLDVLRLAFRGGDFVNVREGLRRWRIADRPRSAERRPRQGAVPSQAHVVVPLAFEAVRRYRAGELADLRTWLDEFSGGESLAEVSSAVEREMSTQDSITERWVQEELPSHEAHVIDSSTDILRALVYMSLIRVQPGRPAPVIPLGPAVRARLEALRRVLGEAANEHGAIAAALKVGDVETRLALVESAVDQAAYTHDREARDVIRRTPIDTRVEQMITEALSDAWAAGFPRRSLNEAEQVEYVVGGKPTNHIAIRALELKEFFIEGRVEESTLRMFATSWATAFLRAELGAIAASFAGLDRYASTSGTLPGRVREGMEALRAAGGTPTQIWGPEDLDDYDALLSDAAFNWTGGAGGEDELGTFFGLPVFGVADVPDVFVVDATVAVTVKQHLWSEGSVFSVAVMEITDEVLAELRSDGVDDVDGDQRETADERIKLRALVEIREAPEFFVDAQRVVRVALEI